MLKRILTSILMIIITTAIFMWLEKKVMESGYIEQKVVDIDGNKYLVPTFVMRPTDPRKIVTVGNKLTCESVAEVLGQRTESNKYFDDIKSPVSKKGTYVDCYEPKTNLLVDYLSEDYYSYNGPDYINNDVYDFYNRMAINESKKEKLTDKKFKYIEVPYKVDICQDIDGKTVCDNKTPPEIRKKRIKDYLREKFVNLI